jgi:hypothetical protein
MGLVLRNSDNPSRLLTFYVSIFLSAIGLIMTERVLQLKLHRKGLEMEKQDEIARDLKELVSYVLGLSDATDSELLTISYNRIIESLMITIDKIDGGE